MPRPVLPLAALLAFAAAGAIAGAGHWPGLAALGWVGVAALAACCARPASGRLLAGGLLAFCLARVFVGHPWHVAFDAVYLGGEGLAWATLPPIAGAWVAPLWATLLAGALAARRLALPAWLWLPLAWIAGEAAHDALIGISHDAWLYGQWQVAPVLRAVAALGWTGALALCLAVAAAAGETLALAAARRPRRSASPATPPAVATAPAPEPVVAPAAEPPSPPPTRLAAAAAIALAGALAIAAMPRVAPAGPPAFAGLAAVHALDDVHPPRLLPAGTTLAVWPELADQQRPKLAEGPNPGAWVEPPAVAPGAAHLYGVRTRTPAGLQNAIVATDPDGRVLGVRAKARLFPVSETPLLGLMRPGATRFAPGTAPPLLTVAGRRAGVLLCLEAQDRALARAAKDAGADLLAIASIDRGVADSPLGQQQLLAVAVLRAAETGLPVVRAARNGVAAFIDRDGTLLAQAPANTAGVLTLAGDAPRAADAGNGDVAVLYARATPAMLPALPAAARARRWAIEGFKDPGVRARTVILSGDSYPPTYLGRPAAEVAAAVKAFGPELVVLDTCYGASAPLLRALADTGVRARVVAPAFRIPASGLVYEPGFLSEPDPARRAALVRTEPPFPLLRADLAPGAIAAAVAAAGRMDRAALVAHLKRVRPPLVAVPLPGRGAPGDRLLVDVPVERFGKTRAPRRRLDVGDLAARLRRLRTGL